MIESTAMVFALTSHQAICIFFVGCCETRKERKERICEGAK